MSLTIQQRKALYWGLGILAAFLLSTVAWAQIHAAITNCFSLF